MVRRIGALLAAVLLILAKAGSGSAEIVWKQNTPAQKVLKDYTERANAFLTETGEMPINRLFEMYDSFAVLGVTAEDDAEVPEGVEITVKLYYETMNTLELRVNDPDRFTELAAALIRALYGDSMSREEARKIPADRAGKAQKNPSNSFEEPVEEMNGTIPRTYYAYFPNQYHDGNSWLQMTLVFPMAGTWDGEGLITGESGERIRDKDEDEDPDYEGYYAEDDYSHLEFFVTPTPEPDSAAAEYDFRKPVGN